MDLRVRDLERSLSPACMYVCMYGPSVRILDRISIATCMHPHFFAVDTIQLLEQVDSPRQAWPEPTTMDILRNIVDRMGPFPTSVP